MSEPMCVQSGHKRCSIQGDENNFTIKYSDRFINIQHTFTNRPTLYSIISERIEQLVTKQITHVGTINSVLKVCKEQVLAQEHKNVQS